MTRNNPYCYLVNESEIWIIIIAITKINIKINIITRFIIVIIIIT